jgi:mannose-1-phosphate guanylyltransferase
MKLLKAFLLVAGRGERLRPLTDTTPKCLLPINGVPLLQIWLEHLEHSGIDEVLINTHWLHEQVQDFVEQWSARHSKIKTILFHEPALLGSAGTLLAHRNWAGQGPFFIIYGDNLTNIDLNRFLTYHNEYGLPLTMRVYRAAEPERVGTDEIPADGILDLSYHVLPRMVGMMKAYDSGEFSLDIGTPESYAKAQRKWSALHQID